jgi:hypothetical protein
VLIAQLTGIAAGHAHVRRTTRDEAFAELDHALAAAGVRDPAARAALLTEAAALYVDPTPDDDRWWAGQAAALLEEAGADLDAARALPAAQRRRRR